MSDAGLKIIVGADVQQAVAGVRQVTNELQSAEKEMAILGTAIDRAIDSGVQDVSKLEDAYQALNNRIKELRQSAGQAIPANSLQTVERDLETINPQVNAAKAGFAGLGLSTSQARIAFIDLGRVVTGQGFSLRSLASNFALLGPGVTIAAAAIYGLVELFTKQTDAEKKAEEEAKRLHDTLLNLKDAQDINRSATGSEEGNIDRVRALAAAITDTNKTYKERKNALDELRETNKAYFGDLTLEAASLKTLSSRVSEYAQALITEAIVKGQVEEIAKVSAEYEKQAHVLQVLKDARDRALNEQQTTKITPTGGGIGSVGGTNISEQAQLASAVSRTESAFLKQRDAVEQLATSIATYRGALNNAIGEQIKQKPLTDAPKQADDLKSIIPVLEQIKRIYDDLAKPNKEPIFKQFADSINQNDIKLIQTQIAEAIKKGSTDGAKDPAVFRAYEDLAAALRAKLSHLENPDLHARIQGIVDVTADDVTGVQTKIEKAFASKGIHVKIPIDIEASLRAAEDQGATQEELKALREVIQRKLDDAKNDIPSIPLNVPIKYGVSKKELSDQIAKDSIKALNDSVTKIKQGIAASGFEEIGIAIGDAINGAGNPLQRALGSFATILGDGLISIGKELILASSIVKGIKSTLDSLFADPIAGIAVGIGAIAAGEVLKNAVKNTGAHAFATGGIITGPTLGLIGEAGPEVVFPLNQLNRFVKNTQGAGVQNINVTGAISGNNIRLAMARTSKLQGLV